MSAAVHALPAPEPVEPETVAVYDKTRLAIAGRLAAGMLANPKVYQSSGWKSGVARDAWDVAGNLMLLATTGGC